MKSTPSEVGRDRPSKSVKKNRGRIAKQHAPITMCDLKFVLMEPKIRERRGRTTNVMREVYTENATDTVECGKAFDAEKPNNAWFQYRADPAVKERHRNKPGSHQESQIVKDMALEWKQLSDAEKLPYEQKALNAAYEHKKRLQQHTRFVSRSAGRPESRNSSARRSQYETENFNSNCSPFQDRLALSDSPIDDHALVRAQAAYTYVGPVVPDNRPTHCYYGELYTPRSTWPQFGKDDITPYTNSSSMNNYFEHAGLESFLGSTQYTLPIPETPDTMPLFL